MAYECIDKQQLHCLEAQRRENLSQRRSRLPQALCKKVSAPLSSHQPWLLAEDASRRADRTKVLVTIESSRKAESGGELGLRIVSGPKNDLPTTSTA